MINFIVGFICGVICGVIFLGYGVSCMVIGTIDLSDETLKNHAVKMKIDRIPYNLEKRRLVVFRVFHKEDRNENAG